MSTVYTTQTRETQDGIRIEQNPYRQTASISYSTSILRQAEEPPCAQSCLTGTKSKSASLGGFSGMKTPISLSSTCTAREVSIL